MQEQSWFAVSLQTTSRMKLLYYLWTKSLILLSTQPAHIRFAEKVLLKPLTLNMFEAVYEGMYFYVDHTTRQSIQMANPERYRNAVRQ